MKIVMDMSSYDIEYESIDNDYDDEILCSGWNPEVDLIREQLQLVTSSEQSVIPEGLATEGLELFLRKMYSYQR